MRTVHVTCHTCGMVRKFLSRNPEDLRRKLARVGWQVATMRGYVVGYLCSVHAGYAGGIDGYKDQVRKEG